MSVTQRLELYENYIFDVAVDISQSEYWRKLLFSNNYDVKFIINSDTVCDIPEYVQCRLREHNLQFYVSKVLEHPEKVDDGWIIFKFESVEFPYVAKYTWN